MVRDVADIEAKVDAIADSGATFIKLMTSSIPPADPLLCARAGVDLLAHGIETSRLTDLVGSDMQGSIGTFPGALHEELRLLVAAGLPAEVVLFQATRGNALFLDPNANYGVVEPGRVADLLPVDGDPGEDIGATEAIVQVFVGGVPVR